MSAHTGRRPLLRRAALASCAVTVSCAVLAACTANAPKGPDTDVTPPAVVSREPMAAPKTTKYSDVVRTGVTTLCTSVRSERAISNL